MNKRVKLLLEYLVGMYDPARDSQILAMPQSGWEETFSQRDVVLSDLTVTGVLIDEVGPSFATKNVMNSSDLSRVIDLLSKVTIRDAEGNEYTVAGCSTDGDSTTVGILRTFSVEQGDVDDLDACDRRSDSEEN